MRSLADDATFPSDTNCSESIVSGDHPTGQVGGSQRKNRGRCPWFYLVLEDDQSEETKATFRLFT
jgi:hypothetical protein